MKTYKAPWSLSLLIISSLTTLLCAGLAGGLIGGRHWITPSLPSWPAVMPLALLMGAALFTIRGYTITDDALLIHRLFWTTLLPLAGLQSARHVPNAMRWSIRTWGNGGLYSFTGHYRNKALGAYRAYVTDLHRTVVLEFPHRRTVVVSPDTAEDFASELALRIPLPE